MLSGFDEKRELECRSRKRKTVVLALLNLHSCQNLFVFLSCTVVRSEMKTFLKVYKLILKTENN